ncbi:MAG: electron transport complex subunit RsxB [Buchnera aphidicola (Brevicoryne brassicae)]|uniref:Ion-translocating oxidoreductase complex subunit B n=1 Tax=Buchnera aphidicola (Brevicoryne brassicae) TaxID=911343 RepID=A0AAJ5PU97_9GAMM|nr:electron transport complex subunit RsxB [Buchnera aphidicola]QCI19696.1 electron transport complex subunit RsxB [Buchnera aphidicola (Brevicoryne brassicae)]WAI19064.1 MAG: electron transport complex subunit RsxB [Buchnera aphidicola (Brevicoryne brassicae)]
MLIIIIFGILSFVFGIILSFSAYKLQLNNDPMIESVNELLPQSQCAQCGYSGCYPYAKAIVRNSEKINKCTPGGASVTLKISELLNIEKPVENVFIKNEKIFDTIAWIDERNCVGCSKCALFCPVDAIIGAPNFLHTVLKDFCTGCNICLSHCPTNCIKIKKR